MKQTHILHSTFKNILYQMYKSCAHVHYPRPCSILLLPVYKCIHRMRTCYQVKEKKITAVATICSWRVDIYSKKKIKIVILIIKISEIEIFHYYIDYSFIISLN